MTGSAKPISAFRGFITCKCPHCRSGNVFAQPLLHNPFAFMKSNDFCPVCGIRFEHETGFFWGAMYISYAFSTGLMIATGVIGIGIFDAPFQYLFITILLTVIVTSPLSFRYSRMLLLYWLSPHKFDPEAYRKSIE